MQEPFTGELTTTVPAVNGAVADEAAEVEIATTQSPAFTADAASATVCRNFVLALQVTATWPFCWLCTCIVLPEIAATVPAAAGPNWPAGLGRPPELAEDGAGDGLVAALALPDDEPPHPASARAAMTPVAAKVADLVHSGRAIME